MINIIGDPEIQSLEKIELPVGYVYIQFPGKNEPSMLFEGTWEEIRTGSISIGTVVDAVPTISCTVSSTCAGAHTHIALCCWFVGACKCYCTVNTSSAGGHTHSVCVTNSGTGTQAYGTTVKVWKRIA